MFTSQITSAQNPKIKEVASLLEKSKTRREKKLFVVEGTREVKTCLNNGFEIESIFLNDSLITANTLNERLSLSSDIADIRIFECSSNVYAKIAYREDTEGIIGVVKERNKDISDIVIKNRTSDQPFIIITEKVEKPGNLGALLRTADACGADAVLICDPLTDLYNPNLIRASLGSFFTVQTVSCSNEEALEWLKSKNIKIFTAQLQDSEWYYDTKFLDGTAIVMGSEAHGLSQFWRNASNAHIKIPMLGEMDSLNVSVSAGILCYEVVRQRMQEKKIIAI